MAETRRTTNQSGEPPRRPRRKGGAGRVILGILKVIGTLILIGCTTGAILACFAATYIKTVIIPQDYVDAMDTLLHFTEEQDAAELYRRYGDVVRIGDPGISGGAYFGNSDGMVYMNAEAVRSGDGSLHRPYQTAFHEFAHAIDFVGLGSGPGSTSNAASVRWRDGDGRSLKRVLSDDWEAYKLRRLMGAVDDGDEDAFEALVGGSPRYMVRHVLRGDHPELMDVDRHDLISNPAFRQAVVESLRSDSPGSMGVDDRAVVSYLKGEHPDIGEAATVSDALEGITDIDYPLGSGHGRNYHHYDGNTELEFFAEVCDSKVCNPAALEFAREVFPDGVRAVEQILREAMER